MTYRAIFRQHWTDAFRDAAFTARLHDGAGHDDAHQLAGTAGLHELPGREAGALAHGAGLVHPHLLDQALLLSLIHI